MGLAFKWGAGKSVHWLEQLIGLMGFGVKVHLAWRVARALHFYSLC